MVKVSLKTKNLLRMLARKNKSQNWLAHQMEISSGYVSQLMTGKRHPSPKMRERILAVMEGCVFDDLFTIENRDGRKRKSK